MVPGMLISIIGSTVLGIALLHAGYAPKLTAWLLALAIPLMFLASDGLGHNSLGLCPALHRLGRRRLADVAHRAVTRPEPRDAPDALSATCNPERERPWARRTAALIRSSRHAAPPLRQDAIRRRRPRRTDAALCAASVRRFRATSGASGPARAKPRWGRGAGASRDATLGRSTAGKGS